MPSGRPPMSLWVIQAKDTIPTAVPIKQDSPRLVTLTVMFHAMVITPRRITILTNTGMISGFPLQTRNIRRRSMDVATSLDQIRLVTAQMGIIPPFMTSAPGKGAD